MRDPQQSDKYGRLLRLAREAGLNVTVSDDPNSPPSWWACGHHPQFENFAELLSSRSAERRCDVCGAEPGRCMTATICAQERESRSARSHVRCSVCSHVGQENCEKHAPVSATLTMFIVVLYKQRQNRQVVLAVYAKDQQEAERMALGRYMGEWVVELAKPKDRPTVFRVFDDAWYEDEENIGTTERTWQK